MNPHYLLTLSLLGLLVSLYALKVINENKKTREYRAFCDVNKTVACSKVLLSKEGNLFGFSNAFLGIVFYFLVFLLAAYNQFFLVLYLSLAAVIFSLYLFFVMAFKLKKFCLLCTAAYVINICLLVLAYLTYLRPF